MISLSEYKKTLADKVCVSVEDLTDTEIKLIESAYYIFKDRLEDLKTLQEEVKRLSIDNANLKAFNDNKDYESNEE